VAIPPNGSVADWDQVDTGSVADLQLRVCCTVIVGHHKLRKVLRAPELCAPPFANTHDDLHRVVEVFVGFEACVWGHVGPVLVMLDDILRTWKGNGGDVLPIRVANVRHDAGKATEDVVQ